MRSNSQAVKQRWCRWYRLICGFALSRLSLSMSDFPLDTGTRWNSSSNSISLRGTGSPHTAHLAPAPGPLNMRLGLDDGSLPPLIAARTFSPSGSSDMAAHREWLCPSTHDAWRRPREHSDGRRAETTSPPMLPPRSTSVLRTVALEETRRAPVQCPSGFGLIVRSARSRNCHAISIGSVSISTSFAASSRISCRADNANAYERRHR